MKRSPRRAFDGGMAWTVFLSVAAHGALLAVILAAPNRYLGAPEPAIQSYTVELVSPDIVSGDSGPMGQGSEPEAVPVDPAGLAADAVIGPEEPEESVAAVPQEPEAVVDPGPEPPEPVDEMEPVEPDPVEVPAPEPPEPVDEPEPADPEPVESQLEPPEPAAEAPGPVVEEVVVATKDEPEPPPEEPAERVATAPPRATPRPPTPDPAAERDRRIAEAVGRRAVASDASGRIAAAVRRRAEQLDSGGVGADGPLSSGPGSGVGGGVIRGTEYLLYKRRMESRIRNSWVWAGSDDSLESVVRFAVSPEGEVGDIRTTRSSGDRAYDDSAERAVRAANPLGMVPLDYRREFADVEMTFRALDLARNSAR